MSRLSAANLRTSLLALAFASLVTGCSERSESAATEPKAQKRVERSVPSLLEVLPEVISAPQWTRHDRTPA